VKTLICPVCKSDKVNLYLGGYAGILYRCASCGYVGPVVIEVDDLNALRELEELSKKTGTYPAEKEHVEDDSKAPTKKSRRGGVK
jgi:uncharacterized Zn finger protein